jgi:hypothetical protein
MLNLEMARKLKDAGLAWQPRHGDLFVAPDRGMDDQLFVINDMATIIEQWRGAPTVTFHGTPEWALDALYLGETLWLPHESQLRELLQGALGETAADGFDLFYADGVYTCRFAWRGEAIAARATDAADAYAAALLALHQRGWRFSA